MFVEHCVHIWLVNIENSRTLNCCLHKLLADIEKGILFVVSTVLTGTWECITIELSRKLIYLSNIHKHSMLHCNIRFLMKLPESFFLLLAMASCFRTEIAPYLKFCWFLGSKSTQHSLQFIEILFTEEIIRILCSFVRCYFMRSRYIMCGFLFVIYTQ